MQEMNEAFNEDTFEKVSTVCLDWKKKLPAALCTINKCLSRLDNQELEKVRKKMVYGVIRKNKWGFLIRYKEGSIPSIMEEYRKHPVHVLELKIERGGDLPFKAAYCTALRNKNSCNMSGRTFCICVYTQAWFMAQHD